MTAIINYGMGNLASVNNALEYLNIEAKIVNDPEKLKGFDKAILPGVGAFGMAMNNLKSTSYDQAIIDFAKNDKKPLLGICLGMQLLLNSSEEYGFHEGLGLVDGKVLDFNGVIKDSPIQHVGWNSITKNGSSPIFNEVDEGESFYFVHRFYCMMDNLEAASALTDYEITFHSALQKDNIFATQFHPEKSQKAGLSIFNEFAKL